MKRTNQFERTGRDITNALLSLMDQKPFEKITVQNILEEAMVNRSTFYQHFTDKYAVLEQLQEKYITGMTACVDRIIAQGEYDLDRINSELYDYFADKRANLVKLASVRTETLDLEGRMKGLFKRYITGTNTRLNTLETELLAGMMVSVVTYSLKSGGEFANISTEVLKLWINMTMFFFRVEDVPDVEERLLGLIRELHGLS